MPIAKQTGANFDPAPQGTHIARCVGCIALGTQPQTNPQFSPTFKVMLTWELPNERIKIEDVEKPMVVSKEYTLSLSEKANLRHDLVGWRGREFTAAELEGFAVENVLDKPCMVTIVHKVTAKKSVYANVASVSGIPKGTVCAARFHPLGHYELEQGKGEEFKKLPEWIQKKIEKCLEWTSPSSNQDGPPDSEPAMSSIDDDVPF